jgi:hypothetical protein
MIYPVPLAAGAGALALALAFWAYHWMPRVQAALFCVAGFTITIAVVPWLDALAGMASTPTGLTVLTVAVILGVLAAWAEVVRKHKHHKIRTPVIAGTFGVTLVLAIADGAALIANLGRSTRMTGKALALGVAQIRDGKAARAVAPDHRMVIVAIGIGIIIALVIIALRFESGKKGRSRPGARPGLPAGRRPAVPAVRRAR